MREFFSDLGDKPFRAQQIMQWDISRLQPGIYFIITNNASIPVGHFVKTAQ